MINLQATAGRIRQCAIGFPNDGFRLCLGGPIRARQIGCMDYPMQTLV